MRVAQVAVMMDHLSTQAIVNHPKPFFLMRTPEAATRSKDRLQVILENLSMIQRGFSMDSRTGSAAQEHGRDVVKAIVRETRDLCDSLSLSTASHRATTAMLLLESDELRNVAHCIQQLVREVRQDLRVT